MRKFSSKKYKNLLFFSAIILTGTISLSAHVFILQYFQAPPLEINPALNSVINFLIRFSTAMAAVGIYFFSREYWYRHSIFHQIIFFGLLIMALTESLVRTPVMNVIVGNPWPYQLLLTIPTYFAFFSLSAAICYFIPRIRSYILVALLAAGFYILTKTITSDFLTPFIARVTQPNPNTAPISYRPEILIPAYITYFEPTVAAFIVFYLIKDQFSSFKPLTQGFILAGLIFALHAGLYSIVQVIFSQGNIFYRLFYYGQFLWEYLILAILTVYSFYWLRHFRFSHGLNSIQADRKHEHV